MLKIRLLFISLIMFSSTALADLSTNPWADANEDEDIEEVYNKRNRRGKGNFAPATYEAEESTVVDRTHAYIQEDDEVLQEDASFMDKMKNIISAKPKEEAPLIANTADNRRKLAEQKAEKKAEKEESSNSLIPSFGLGSQGSKSGGALGGLGGLTNGLKLPNMNATGMIQKFEKASGINLKSIGKQFK